MKSAVYALLCFIFIVSGHIQELEANLMKRCTRGFRKLGKCTTLEEEKCKTLYPRGQCTCSDSKMNTHSCDCKSC
uniref:S locus protein 11 n=2 Tax=Brassica campestris TaxID=3711 RepID=Q9SE17_BRACM|nr:S-locus cysteine-rich protein [Brassica rapa subsp. oleifera]BAA92246.1 S-locus pollen protein [Brassica rapa]BAF91376.1 S locus protein 11 [Brassica rapa]